MIAICIYFVCADLLLLFNDKKEFEMYCHHHHFVVFDCQVVITACQSIGVFEYAKP